MTTFLKLTKQLKGQFKAERQRQTRRHFLHGFLIDFFHLVDRIVNRGSDQVLKHLPADGMEGDGFGIYIAISGSTAIVGASGDDANGRRSGSAYLFDTTTGDQIAKLLADDGAELDQFGLSVAISPDSIGTAIVGAWLHDDNGSQSGAAYLFDTTTGLQITKLLPNDGAVGDNFGRSVAISPDSIGSAIVGASGNDDNGTDSGSAYLFDTTPGGLTWFNNQADFEAFNQGEGKVLKGIEDYEESILNPNATDAFDDSLESGVPNAPDGFPFPVGLTGLPNLIVQSNVGGGNPADENPHGRNALAALTDGVFGVVSDVVLANFFADSLDLIFTDGKSAVGFNTITLADNDSVEVRVYSTTNVFLGMMPSPADPAGADFIGVWSSDPIGRINIFNPNFALEGGDNIQAWGAAPCPWDLDNNGSVGASDLLSLLVRWGSDPGGPPDFDGDGNVGAADLLSLLVNWGPCP